LRPDSHGHITGRWSKWFNRYLDGVVGITDATVDFHSFRHTFKLATRAAGIPEDQHDALTGHANASVSRAYGSAEGYPLEPLAKAITKLRYRGLDVAPVRANTATGHRKAEARAA
jgi:integrase